MIRLQVSLNVPRRALVAFGWTFVVGISVKSVGGLFGDGRVQIRQSRRQYAYRTRDPMLFWGKSRVSCCWSAEQEWFSLPWVAGGRASFKARLIPSRPPSRRGPSRKFSTVCLTNAELPKGLLNTLCFAIVLIT